MALGQFGQLSHGLSYNAITSSKVVLSTVNSGPPPFTVDTTIFELWVGSLSRHTGLAIPVS